MSASRQGSIKHHPSSGQNNGCVIALFDSLLVASAGLPVPCVARLPLWGA
jgi:hypothetical protein